MKKVLVADIMTREPVTISPDANLLDCAKKMVKKRVGSLIITEKKKLVGFISQKDILWALIKKSNKDLTNIKAIEISPKKIAIIKPSCTIDEAIEKMKKLKFERLPVIHENKLVGVLTAKDILNFHPEVYPEMEEFARVKEESDKLKRIKKAEKRSDGVCEECGNEGILFRVNGMLVCESCKDSV
ncbi:CBS domain-containing protein [Candidatus Pacearchaeota archaeon]|nr:CBS domain-containing protein [Candidatus Pacearchaeota archaeon]